MMYPSVHLEKFLEHNKIEDLYPDNPLVAQHLEAGDLWMCKGCESINHKNDKCCGECCLLDDGTCCNCAGEGTLSCGNCSGTGEGSHDDARCWMCHGRGITECTNCQEAYGGLL
jgi:hypothetical protein